MLFPNTATQDLAAWLPGRLLARALERSMASNTHLVQQKFLLYSLLSPV